MGDISIDTYTDEDSSFDLINKVKMQMDADLPFLFTKGNHDYNGYALSTQKNSLWATIFLEPLKRKFKNITIKNNETNGGYGYIDDDNAKIRTYFLNTSDINEPTYSMSTIQLQFIADSLAGLLADWKVIILNHLCVDSCGEWTSYPNETSSDDFDTFRSIMSDFVSKSNGTNIVTGVTWAFSTVPASCKLICNFAGDSHFDNNATTNGVNYILRQGYGNIPPSEIAPGGVFTEFDAENQILFDIIAVKLNGNAKIFRIGAGGSSRDLSFSY
jgi:hypothetical protein